MPKPELQKQNGAALPLKPASGRRTLQQEVYQQLRDALINGELEPGQSLKAGEIAKMMGTSLVPVREALLRLVAERALQTLPNGLVQVPNPSPEELAEIGRLRVLLEMDLVKQAAEVITAEDMDRMLAYSDLVLEALAEGDLHRYVVANRQVVRTLMEAAPSPITIDIVHSLWMRFGPHMAGYLPTHNQAPDEMTVDRELLVYERLRKALKARDRSELYEVTREDLLFMIDQVNSISEEGSGRD